MKIQKTLLRQLIKEALTSKRNNPVFSLVELKDYLKDLVGQDIGFYIPTPKVAGFDGMTTSKFTSPEETLKAVEEVKPYKGSDPHFELWSDDPKLKHFAYYRSPEAEKAHVDSVRKGGSLD